MEKYSLGIDFGTLSGRAVLALVSTGEQIAESSMDYPHGVMDDCLPGGAGLPHDWALQHPQDYLDVLSFTTADVLKKSGVSPSDIIGVGIDFTASTILPVLSDGTPLCFLEEYRDNPHAYAKLWKHHAAQDKANKINEIAADMGEEWLKRYGGKISSEWLVPKVWQILDEAPEIYERAGSFIEAGDWIVWQLTGKETRNSCAAGYKALWSRGEGYPGRAFFAALDKRLENLVAEKLSGDVIPVGEKAGEITGTAARLTGLREGTAVAAANVDAHVAAPAVGLSAAGELLMIMGTSTCHLLLSEQGSPVPGICGVARDGILPGLFGYEAGQAAVGDIFAWFMENCIPAHYSGRAAADKISVYEHMSRAAEGLKPGESGLIALDWWNGNRSVLVDADLSGVILGLTLSTKPEEIYRALIESTAFGTKMILENFIQNGAPIKALYAAGGIAEKDAFIMQLYSDVLGMEIKISGSPQAPALGSAIFGALAAGGERGGYDTVSTAAKNMGKLKERSYKPNAANHKVYGEIYKEYRLLHDYFGKGANESMKRLRQLKKR